MTTRRLYQHAFAAARAHVYATAAYPGQAGYLPQSTRRIHPTGPVLTIDAGAGPVDVPVPAEAFGGGPRERDCGWG